MLRQCQQRRQRLCQQHAAPGGHAGDVQVSACVAPGQRAVPDSFRHCRAAFDAPAGSQWQEAFNRFAAGQSFQPMTVRVSRFGDCSSHAGAGRQRNFSGGGVPSGELRRRRFRSAESSSRKNPPPVIVSSSRLSVLSDALGLATFQPSTGGAQGALVIQGTASAGIQRSSLPAPVFSAGDAIGAVGFASRPPARWAA